MVARKHALTVAGLMGFSSLYIYLSIDFKPDDRNARGREINKTRPCVVISPNGGFRTSIMKVFAAETLDLPFIHGAFRERILL